MWLFDLSCKDYKAAIIFGIISQLHWETNCQTEEGMQAVHSSHVSTLAFINLFYFYFFSIYNLILHYIYYFLPVANYLFFPIAITVPSLTHIWVGHSSCQPERTLFFLCMVWNGALILSLHMGTKNMSSDCNVDMRPLTSVFHGLSR